jgi:hypothetical protein
MTQIIRGTTLQLQGVSITFQRTLRIPDNGKTYPLPPGLGEFPLRRVRDFASRVPDGWAERGGVFLPMYQREAMWIRFAGTPHALKVGIGKVCAITGEAWTDELSARPQNYVVTGTQPWLDGVASGKGTIRQFVAMPLGRGYTVEAQLTGAERFGGIQLEAFAPEPGRLRGFRGTRCGSPGAPARSRGAAMGLAAGGKMKQKIYPDPHGLDVWDRAARSRVFVHIVNSELWREITSEAAPATPVRAESYIQAGLPWFELYDEHAATLSPTSALAGVKSIAQLEQTDLATAIDDGDW